MKQSQFNRQIERFNTVAKLTHTKYGTSRLPATIELWKNDIVVATIASHRITISKNAQPGWCMAKKIHDHATFKMSCTAINKSGIFAAMKPSGLQTSQAAIAIITKSVVHTGPTMQSGALGEVKCAEREIVLVQEWTDGAALRT